ncbi:conserved Plasmodium protein, unknown function [Plasmodium reichenowi]|uniref:Uncharacterized protein n=1 Tax=Plasmodium reichenowi TaxID=5854 RepID=A0A2P9DTC3_PLARE|nr:conserved Plasmodium protein, unknown function [Plasmodium reichenowi]
MSSNKENKRISKKSCDKNNDNGIPNYTDNLLIENNNKKKNYNTKNNINIKNKICKNINKTIEENNHTCNNRAYTDSYYNNKNMRSNLYNSKYINTDINNNLYKDKISSDIYKDKILSDIYTKENMNCDNLYNNENKTKKKTFLVNQAVFFTPKKSVLNSSNEKKDTDEYKKSQNVNHDNISIDNMNNHSLYNKSYETNSLKSIIINNNSNNYLNNIEEKRKRNGTFGIQTILKRKENVLLDSKNINNVNITKDTKETRSNNMNSMNRRKHLTCEDKEEIEIHTIIESDAEKDSDKENIDVGMKRKGGNSYNINKYNKMINIKTDMNPYHHSSRSEHNFDIYNENKTINFLHVNKLNNTNNEENDINSNTKKLDYLNLCNYSTEKKTDMLNLFQELLSYCECLKRNRKKSSYEIQKIRVSYNKVSDLLKETLKREQNSHIKIEELRNIIINYNEKFDRIKNNSEGTITNLSKNVQTLIELNNNLENEMNKMIDENVHLRKIAQNELLLNKEINDLRKQLEILSNEKVLLIDQIDSLRLENSKIENEKNVLLSDKTVLNCKIDVLENQIKNNMHTLKKNLSEQIENSPFCVHTDKEINEHINNYLNLNHDDRTELFKNFLYQWRETNKAGQKFYDQAFCN